MGVCLEEGYVFFCGPMNTAVRMVMSQCTDSIRLHYRLCLNLACLIKLLSTHQLCNLLGAHSTAVISGDQVRGQSLTKADHPRKYWFSGFPAALHLGLILYQHHMRLLEDFPACSVKYLCDVRGPMAFMSQEMNTIFLDLNEQQTGFSSSSFSIDYWVGLS